MDNHIKAEKDYVKGMKYKEIAEKYNVSINTVKSWKQRYGWSRKKGAHKEKRVHTKKTGAPYGNINAKGNKGGSAPTRNKNAEKHGLFSKYLPEETLELINEIEDRSPLNMLWDQIKIQYAAIIRSQSIMHVTDKDEMIKELKKKKVHESENISSTETEYEFQFAWDRQATLLKAQSRAMGELRSMIKQYDELLNTELATEEQKIRIRKLKAETSKIESDGTNQSPPVINIIDSWSE